MMSSRIHTTTNVTTTTTNTTVRYDEHTTVNKTADFCIHDVVVYVI